MSNNVRTRDGGVFNFVDGLKVKNVDIEEYMAGESATNLTTTVTATTVNINSSTGTDTVIPAATPTEAGVMSAADKVKLSGINLTAKQDTLVSGTNIKTINGESILGSGNIDIVVDGGASTATNVTFSPVGNLAATNVQAAVAELDTEKQQTLVSGTNIKTINTNSLLGTGNISVQDTLVSGTNIKTINNTSILGSGNIAISGGAATATDVTFAPSGGLSSTNVQAAIVELDTEKQTTLVSGTNIKTINSSSLLGTGDVVLQAPLVSGTTIKTINNLSILGSGNIDVAGGAATASAVSVTPVGNIAATNVQTALAELDSEKQITLVSGTNIKTINNTSILGSGNINISGGATTATDVTFTPIGGLSSTNVQTALVELDSEKQVTLVSGTNIKTINGSSILGSGNIAISGGASDASSVTFAPVGNIASTSVQAAIAELDSEKQITLVSGTNIKTINSSSLLGTGNVALQVPLVSGTTIKTINADSLLGSGNVSVQPTLVSGTNIKTINGTSLLGAGNISVSGPVVSKIKIAIIGDSSAAQSTFTQEAWPSFLEKNLIAGGMDVEVYNFAIVGERYFTANNAQYESGATQLQKAVAISPDIIIVALGINDALSDRSLVDAKADALTAYNTLRTGAPAAKIIYASQIYWDITHKPLGTSLLNREVVPFLFQLRTSGFLSESYCSSILTDAASTTGHAIIAKWKELDTYIKLLQIVDETFSLDGYKVARLGLLGEDFIHPSQDGSKFLAGQALKAFKTLSSLSALTASLRTPIYPNWDDPDSMFALFCESNGSEWVTKASTIASQHISSITSLTRAYRPNNWYMPTRGSMYIGNSNIGSTLPAVAMVEGVKPNTLIELSVNGGAWADTPYITSSHGTAITVDVSSNLFIGTNDYYYRIYNEVYGPYTITTTATTPLTKADVGLGNVDNTSDANKPVSIATQNALNEKQTTLVSGTNIKTINGTSLLGSGDISVSGGSPEYYVFGSNSSIEFNAPETECVITGWSLLTSSGSSVTTNGAAFFVQDGAWLVSCSLGITLPPNVGIYSKFRTAGTPSGLTEITGSSIINGTDTTSYATSTVNGVVISPYPTPMLYVAIASGSFKLNPDGFAHRITFMKV